MDGQSMQSIPEPRQKTPADHLDQRRADLLQRQEAAQSGYEAHARQRAEHNRWCEVLELELRSIKAALEQLAEPDVTDRPPLAEPEGEGWPR